VTASVVDPFGNVLGIMYNPHYLEILQSSGEGVTARVGPAADTPRERPSAHQRPGLINDGGRSVIMTETYKTTAADRCTLGG
jgi:hypothetical protein